MNLKIDRIIKLALEEDLPYGDLTSIALIKDDQKAKGIIINKEEIILAGIKIAKRVFEIIDNTLQWKNNFNDGERLKPFTEIAIVEGKAVSILAGERTALNFLQHLCGISTKVYKLAKKAASYDVLLTDTRKTLPGLRALQKYAVKIGGGYNHRFSLSDGILIKNNHLKFFSNVSEAIKRIKDKKPYLLEIEVEVSNMEELKEALELNPDIIMLDNFPLEELEEAIKVAKGKCRIEISGNVNEDNIEEIIKLRPNYISMGSLTHSVRASDIHMKIEPL